MASLTKRKFKNKYKVTSQVYYITWYDNHRKRFKSTGKSRRDEAERVFQLWKNNQNNYHGNIFLSELIPEVLKFVKLNRRTGTYDIYKNTLNHFLNIIKDKSLKLITFHDIEYYKSERIKTVCSTTLNIELRTIKATLNMAVDFGYIQFNPVKKIKQLDVDKKPLKTFSQNQIKYLLDNISNKVIRKAFIIGIFTGCRLNEIVNLRYGNIENNNIVIYSEGVFHTKTGEYRIIPISEELHNEIFEPNILNLPENYLLGKLFTKSYITRRFKHYLRKFNYPECLTFHCLRHTFATELVKAGVPLPVIKELLGHRNIKTTEIYLHIDNEQKQNAVNRLSYR